MEEEQVAMEDIPNKEEGQIQDSNCEESEQVEDVPETEEERKIREKKEAEERLKKEAEEKKRKEEEKKKKEQDDCQAFVEGLTQEEAKELRDAFSLFDKDGSNTIERKELGPVLRALGRNPTEKEIKDIMDVGDEDGDGKLSYDEYVAIISNHMTPLEDVKIGLHQAFLVFDEDKSGTLDVKELQRVLCEMGEPLTISEAMQVIEKIDTNKDGKIQVDEFVNFLQDIV